MALLEEIREYNFQVICEAPHNNCKAFEYNSGALKLARLSKLTRYKTYQWAHQNLSHQTQKSIC
ncbi:hypothetical protein ACHAW6_001518 [Cyclotella cf. meneghiniana]